MVIIENCDICVTFYLKVRFCIIFLSEVLWCSSLVWHWEAQFKHYLWHETGVACNTGCILAPVVEAVFALL